MKTDIRIPHIPHPITDETRARIIRAHTAHTASGWLRSAADIYQPPRWRRFASGVVIFAAGVVMAVVIVIGWAG